jgi:hypothetical protein
MSLISSIAKLAREITAHVLTDGLNVLGTAANPIQVNIGGTQSQSAVTTSATPLNVVLDTPSKSTTRAIRLLVSATKSDGSLGASWLVLASIRCDSSGTLSLLGDAATLWSELDATFTPSVDINVSGGSIVAALTGMSSTTINWSLKSEVA